MGIPNEYIFDVEMDFNADGNEKTMFYIRILCKLSKRMYVREDDVAHPVCRNNHLQR